MIAAIRRALMRSVAREATPAARAEATSTEAKRDDLRLGVRYLASYIHQLKNSARGQQHDQDLVDQIAILGLLAEFIPRMQGQLGQDVLALAMSGFKRGGTFIEIGAYDGVHMSNTYLLEVDYGWTGALVEANPSQAGNFGRRKSLVLQKAAWSRSGLEIMFRITDEPALAHVAEVGSTDGHDRRDASDTKVETITVDDAIAQLGNPAVVDFISIDTEGAEMEVLAGLSFDRTDVRCLCIEHAHDAGRLAELDAAILPHGYKRVLVDVSDFDALYVKADAYAAWQAENARNCRAR